MFMDLDSQLGSFPADSLNADNVDFNSSMEGDFWSTAPPPAIISNQSSNQQQQAATSTTSTYDDSFMMIDGQYVHTSHTQQQSQQSPIPQYHHHHDGYQHQQQHHQHPSNQHLTNFPSSSPPLPLLTPGHTRPSMNPHLFATPFSPFHHASFEVENDLNGVNPSSMFTSGGGGGGGGVVAENAPVSMMNGQHQHQQQHHHHHQQQQQQLGGYTSTGSHLTNTPMTAPPPLIPLLRGSSEDESSQFIASNNMHIGPMTPNLPTSSSSQHQHPMQSTYEYELQQHQQRVQTQQQAQQQAQQQFQQQHQHQHQHVPPHHQHHSTPTSSNSSSSGSGGPTTSSRKRARGATGVAHVSTVYVPPTNDENVENDDDGAIELRPEDELRNLSDSTFTIPRTTTIATTTTAAQDAARAARFAFTPTGNDETDKKVKHQLTDRQRRAKIKESMDALKKLVPLEPNQKADQATIVASSVTTISNLQDEVAQLRKKLHAMELNTTKESNKLDAKRSAIRGATGGVGGVGPNGTIPLLSNAPFTSMMASLNGAGVSMWRIGLTGKIIEVNLVFELVSGFSAAEVVGNTPCGPPLFGSLSIMPSAFLKAFSEVSQVPQLQQQSQNHSMNVEYESGRQIANDPHLLPMNSNHSSSATLVNHNAIISPPHSGSTSPITGLEFPISPASSSNHSIATGGGGVSSTPSPTTTPNTPTVNPSSTASTHSQASVAPLYANASISNFPVVPQTELENFFPYKCRSLINAHRKSMETGVQQPQPHGNFLVAHLAALPYNHVLKLLCRHHTLWGEILESIVTLCLVRDASGQPDYIMLLSTSDPRESYTQHES